MRLKCLWIGETRDPLLARLESEYVRRIQRFLPIERLTVPESRKEDPRHYSSQLEKEARLLEKKIALKTFLVTLDEKGKELTSVGFARFLEDCLNRGRLDLTFLGGGHMGLPGRVLERSDMRLALSKLTLPHELARVVLLEQIFRGMTIIKGLPYHR